jgi:hypothetical protein
VNLLSIDIGGVMSLLTGDSNNSEDATYLSAAIENAKVSKDHMKVDEFPQAMKFALKAFKRVEELYNLRKELHPEY